MRIIRGRILLPDKTKRHGQEEMEIRVDQKAFSSIPVANDKGKRPRVAKEKTPDASFVAVVNRDGLAIATYQMRGADASSKNTRERGSKNSTGSSVYRRREEDLTAFGEKK